MQLMTLSNGSLIIGLAVISEVIHVHQLLKALYIMIHNCGLIASCFCSINFALLKPNFEPCSYCISNIKYLLWERGIGGFSTVLSLALS